MGTRATYQADLEIKPVEDHERYLAVDVLRGLALFGVLLVNDLDFFRVSLFQQLLTFHTHIGWANHFVDVLAAFFLEFKAFSLFSFLFGVGIAIQHERLASRGRPAAGFLARRFMVLFGMGLVHMFLISNVDILILYAVCGLLLISVLSSPTPLLLGLSFSCIALNFILSFGPMLPTETMMRGHALAATSVYSTGSFENILVFRFHETWRFIFPLIIAVLPKTIGLMLLGIAAWRAGVLQTPSQHRRLLRAVMYGGATLGAIATGLVVCEKSIGHTVNHPIPRALLEATSYIPLSCAYASAVLLAMLNRTDHRAIVSIAALGQMALTNYLMQSVILGFIFYGYGFALFGKLGSLPAALIGLLIYVAQVGFSRAWLRRYRYGPVEWLWRSLTYAQCQPMRRAAGS